MSQIPLGQFAAPRVVPTPERGGVINMPDGSRALQQVAASAFDAADTLIRQKSREDQALARVKASNAIIDRESQLKNLSSDIEEKMRTGQLDWSKGEEAYSAAVSQLDPLQVDGLDEAGQGELANSLKRLQVGGVDRIRAASLGARVESAKADIASRMDMIGKDAALPGADIGQLNARMDADDIDLVGRIGYGEKWDAMKQSFKDDNWATQATQRVIGARDGLGELEQIRTDLTSADSIYAKNLSPDKRNQLLNTVTGRIYQVQAHQQQQAVMREIKAERALTQMDKQASLGMPPTPADQQKWKAATEGTSLSGEFEARVHQMNESQRFLQLPEIAQEKYLTDIKSSMQQNGASVSDIENLNRLESVRDARNKLRESDPVTYSAVTTGSQIEPISLRPDTISTPEGQQLLLAQLGERFLVSASVRREGGASVTPTPWTQAEQDSLAAVAKLMDDKTKLSIFGVISAATQDKAEYSAAIKPFAGDDLLVGTAGRAAFQGYRLPDGSSLAQTIMDGRKILTDKSKPMPEDNLFRPAFDKAIGFSMPTGSEQRDMAYQTYRAAYAALSERKSKSFNGVTLDQDISDEAIQAATGGITNWAGKKVVKPYGMPDEDFMVSVGAQLDSMAERTGIPAGQLKQMPLMAAPKYPGYYVLMNGGQIQRDPSTQQDLMVKP
ncbi:hypothetical protein [Pseudomonas solani]|uniref:hypothetical protein n=1 Tax=Pseudomonas solani TaxID=2731552 RepID=UPI003D6A1750